MRYLALLLGLSLTLHAQDFVQFLGGSVGLNNGLLNDLTAYWRFEETTGNALDSSGNGRTLTENGTVNSEPGLVGNDRLYSSTDHSDYFTRASDSAFAFAGKNFTFSCWAFFNPRSGDPNDMTIAEYGDWTGTNFSWWLFLDHGSPNDTMHFYWSTDGTFNPANDLPFPFVGEIPSGYNFIALRWNGTTLHLSVTQESDVALASDVTASFSGTLFADGTQTLTIGAAPPDTTHDMGGDIDEMGVWSAYKSDCSLQWLFTQKGHSFTYPNFDALTCVSPP